MNGPHSTTGTIHRHMGLYSSHSQSIETPGVSMGPKMGYQMVVNECPSSPSPGLPIIMPAAVVAANNIREEAAMAGSVSEVGAVVSEAGGVDGEDQRKFLAAFCYTGLPRLVRFQLVRSPVGCGQQF